MQTHINKSEEAQQQSIGQENTQKQGVEDSMDFVDNSPEAIQMRAFQDKVDNSEETLQLKAYQDNISNTPEATEMGELQSSIDGSDEVFELQNYHDDVDTDSAPNPDKPKNTTGIPDALKQGIESLSGISMDDVKVHYNSSKPAEVGAYAYAVGTDVYIGPGQEGYLPHELWHVVQQKQGQVKATTDVNGQQVNDDSSLEKEADVMGRKSLQPISKENNLKEGREQSIIQRVINPMIIKEFADKLGMDVNLINVVEIPKDNNSKDNNSKNKILTSTPFSGYGEKYIYGEFEKTKSIDDLIPGEKKPENIMAKDYIGLGGGAAYFDKLKLSIVTENKSSEQDLLHEMGHAKQHLGDLGATGENTTRLLLEWHNILYHENLYDPTNIRTSYSLIPGKHKNKLKKWEKAYKVRDYEDKKNILKEMDSSIKVEYEKLYDVLYVGKALENKNKPKDKELYKLVYDKIEEMIKDVNKANSWEWSFSMRCTVLNLMRDLVSDLGSDKK